MRVQRLTPAGVGGVALVELSGPGAADALASLLDRPPPAAGRVRLARLRTPEGEPVDDLLVACADRDVFELGCHGGPAVVEAILALLVRVGARTAEVAVADAPPGQRVRLEAGAGLERTTTELGTQLMLRQAAAWEAALDALLPLLTVDPVGARSRLEGLLATARLGAGVLVPPRVVLCGPPNAGKSSLLNALVGRERVLVSEHPGTTRDAIEELIEVGGLPVRLVDTAGLRDSADAIEEQGVARAERLAAAADARLVVVDLSAPEAGLATAGAAATPRVVVGNKLDLAPASGARPEAIAPPWVAVSAITAVGLEALRAELRRALIGDVDDVDDAGAVVFTPRQEGLLSGALRALDRGDPARSATCLRAVRGG